MKAPADPVQHADPITADELCEIFTEIIDQPPKPEELSALAAALDALRLRHLNPDENIVVLDLSTQQRLALSGMPSMRRMIAPSITQNWHTYAFDIFTALQAALAPTEIGKHFAARFLARVIPRITGETPSVGTIERWLKGPDHRKRHKPRTR